MHHPTELTNNLDISFYHYFLLSKQTLLSKQAFLYLRYNFPITSLKKAAYLLQSAYLMP